VLAGCLAGVWSGARAEERRINDTTVAAYLDRRGIGI
jgi:hypothetical protein